MMISQSVLIFHPLRLSVFLIDWMWSFDGATQLFFVIVLNKPLNIIFLQKILCQPSRWNALKWQNSAQPFTWKCAQFMWGAKRDGYNFKEKLRFEGGVTIVFIPNWKRVEFEKNGCIRDYGFVHSFTRTFFGLANMHVLII